MDKKLVFFSFFVISLFFSVQASALIIGSSGHNSPNDSIIAAPANVNDDKASNTYQQGFNEVQNYTLLSDLDVDGGSISAGTLVSSHMIFLNTATTAYAKDTQEWKFDGLILGVMSDYNGYLEVASSNFLGNPGTLYPSSGFAARGLEGDPLSGTENDWYTVSENSLNLYMQVTEPGDWIRVVTAAPVPEPATFILLGSGLAGLAFYRKKKK